MRLPKIDQAKIDRIAGADPHETNDQLAEALGISPVTVKKYRQQARRERREIAHEVIEKRVQDEMPNALAALGDCVETAHRKMKETDHPDYIRECRVSAKTLLDYLGLAPDKDPLGDVPDEHLLDQISERLGLRR